MAPLIESTISPLLGTSIANQQQHSQQQPNNLSNNNSASMDKDEKDHIMNHSMKSKIGASHNDKSKTEHQHIPTTTSTTPILVEIIGATNLTHPTPSNKNNNSISNNRNRSSSIIRNLKPIHPFVIAKLHTKDGTTKTLTKTKRVKNNSDPIWSVEHQCLFLLHVTDDMLLQTPASSSPSFIEFDIRHNKVINDSFSSTHLCSATMDVPTLWDQCLNHAEERFELPLLHQKQRPLSISPKSNDSTTTTAKSDNYDFTTKSMLKKVRIHIDGDVDDDENNDDDEDDDENENDNDDNEQEEDDQEDENLNDCKIAIRARFASELDLTLMNQLQVMYKRGKYTSFHCDTQSFINDMTYDDDDDDDDNELDDSEECTKKKKSSDNNKTNDGNNFNKNKKVEFITERSQQSVGYTGVLNMLSSPFRNSKTDRNGVLKYKVKPYPDPDRKEETTFLSHAQMEEEMMKPSTNWIAAGMETSQSLGQVYLEILQCSNLPNMDAGEALGNKTDAFVCAIFEESMVQTDVIDDKLSPFWFPWCQRAFVFQITHASSPLFISVFDFDMGPGGHDGIGRIAVNLSHFKANTLYTLEYNIYPASNVTTREPLGTITIRLRKEIKDEKKLLLQSLEPAPRFHVNMKKRMSLPVANYTCFGAHNEEKFDFTLIRSYVNEMLELKRFLKYAISDAISSLIMWRGQVQIGKYLLPLHSAMAFFGGIYVIERPHMIPGCFFLSIAWVMLASLNARIHHPSPWQRTLPFSHYLSLLVLGKSYLPSDEIRPMQCHRESCRFEANWNSRIKTDLDVINKAWELQLEMDKIGNENLQTEEQNLADPVEIAKAKMSPWLFPIQRRLRTYCGYLREIKKVTTWEDGMLSFWITLPCIVIGIALLILPSVFLIHWLCRLFIWICLGPWLRLYYEVFVVDHSSPMYFDNNEKRKEYAKQLIQNISEQFQESRMKGEDAMKMKAMRTIRFGEHIARVPPTNTTRHYDFPISQSKASHLSNFPDHQLPQDVALKVVPSQRLVGKMIPMTEEQMKIIALKSKKVDEKDTKKEDKRFADVSIHSQDPVSETNPDRAQPSNGDNTQDWLDTTLNHFTSLTFQGRTKIVVPTSSSSEEIDEMINVEDNVVHISARNVVLDNENCANRDDKSELSNLTDQDFDDDEEIEEEGLEVIAWEQTALSVKLNGEDVDIDDDSSEVTESSLSAVYKSSDSVYMTFCRTPRSACEEDKRDD